MFFLPTYQKQLAEDEIYIMCHLVLPDSFVCISPTNSVNS